MVLGALFFAKLMVSQAAAQDLTLTRDITLSCDTVISNFTYSEFFKEPSKAVASSETVSVAQKSSVSHKAPRKLDSYSWYLRTGRQLAEIQTASR